MDLVISFWNLADGRTNTRFRTADDRNANNPSPPFNNKGLSPERDSSVGTPGGANYVSANLDDEGLMAFIAQETHPVHAEEPYRAVQVSMSKGLRRLASDVGQGEIGSISDLFPQE